jgi:lipopolysaccharide/colanic/teichoic acid biosynthesis glycosyltransferase
MADMHPEQLTLEDLHDIWRRDPEWSPPELAPLHRAPGDPDIWGHRDGRFFARLINRNSGIRKRGERGSVTRLVKRLMDVTVASVLLLLLAPSIAIIAVAIKVTDPGPVTYRQIRVGYRGRPFVLRKFRTMYVDADLRRAKLLSEDDDDGLMFKMRADPRITRVGRFLRRYSLDEIPQFVNVIRGEMALVGPRPPLPEEVHLHNEYELQRLAVKPGMTGLWQVSGRSNLSWSEGVRLDLSYVDNWSIGLDIVILTRTMGAVVRGTGAY